jgi:glutamine---fructose-6-phosphate transaminase (isomerizing)
MIMCGIAGMISQVDIVPRLVEGMSRIPYHDSDSCGLAILSVSTIDVRKDIGSLQEASHQRGFNLATGTIGIAHVGKLVEGRISRKNAQPHLSCDGKFAVVNDGVISNSQRLRANLETTGRHFFFSDASAEVFAHLLEEAYWVSHSVEEAFAQGLQQIEGDFAIAVISNCESPRIFCAHNNKPLLIGTAVQTTFVSSNSDTFQFDSNPHLLREGQYAILSDGGYSVASISHPDKEILDPDSSIFMR